MTNKPPQATIPELSGTHTRRDVLRGALVGGAGALALSAFGGHLTAPTVAARGALAQDELLPRSKIVLPSAIAVNLTNHSVTLPLHQGMFNGQPVWYVITESSDERIARDLGLNFAPRLGNIPAGHPAVQQVRSGNPTLGRDMVTFAGVPNFGFTRLLTPGPKGFPAARFLPGAIAGAGYSDLVRVQGSEVVYNAPIVAMGPGPFDVAKHDTTHDRTLAIDTAKMTIEMLIVRAFAHGQESVYISFSATNPLAAVIERAIFIPALAKVPMTNTRTVQQGSRSSIFAFVNGQRGAASPPAQGLNHNILDTPSDEPATLQNRALLDSLRQGGDPRNVLDTFTTLRDPALARLYVPLWDLQLVRWSDEAVAQGRHTAQADANQIRQLAAQGMVTAPDGRPLVSANIIANCPILGFTDQPPTEPQAPDPGRTPNAP